MLSSSKRILIFLSPLCFLIFYSSCSSIKQKELADYYRNHPISLFYSTLQNSLEIETFQGNAHLTVESPIENFQGNAKVFYKRPDSLFVQIQAGFGVPLGSMLVIGDKVQLYNIRDRVLFRSEGADVPLDDLIGMNLRAGNLIEATLGLPRPPSFQISTITEDDSISYDSIEGNFKYYLDVGSEEREYIADPDEQVFTHYSIIRTENDTTACTFKNFRRFKNIRIPQHVQIIRYKQKERLAFFYTRMNVNKKLPNNRFQIKISDNVEVINLTEPSYD